MRIAFDRGIHCYLEENSTGKRIERLVYSNLTSFCHEICRTSYEKDCSQADKSGRKYPLRATYCSIFYDRNELTLLIGKAIKDCLFYNRYQLANEADKEDFARYMADQLGNMLTRRLSGSRSVTTHHELSQGIWPFSETGMVISGSIQPTLLSKDAIKTVVRQKSDGFSFIKKPTLKQEAKSGIRQTASNVASFLDRLLDF